MVYAFIFAAAADLGGVHIFEFMSKTAYIFPGQGAQFPGMASDLYNSNAKAKALLDEANAIIGFDILHIMFDGTEDDLRQTRVTQPAIFLHSMALVAAAGSGFQPDMVAGHSLGEFSALAAASVLSWQDALRLVSLRAEAMQRACEMKPGTMAAILGLDDALVKEGCEGIKDDIVVAANLNSPGQVVISGTISGVEKACEVLKAKGAKRAVMLSVGGAFHSPLMEPAREELAAAINEVRFSEPICPVYQNFSAQGERSVDALKSNLLAQLTAPVRWTESINAMIADGAGVFIEAGPGNVLQGLVKKIDRNVQVQSLNTEAVTQA